MAVRSLLVPRRRVRSLKHNQLTGKTDLNNGSWHTITCTKTSGQITLTVDGMVD